MRKHISTLIIYSILLQLFSGCYSVREITINELKNFDGNNEVKLTTLDNINYTLKRDSSYQNFSDWVYVDDTIEWTETKLVQQKNTRSRQLVTTKNEINENDIANIGIEEFDGLKTLLLSVGILALIVVIGTLTFELPEGSLSGSF